MEKFEYEKLIGKMAFSKAGHDKGKLYVIVKEDPGYVWLSDGRVKLKNAPKKKKRIHIQPVRHLPDEVGKILADLDNLDDAGIRKVIRRVKQAEHIENDD